MTSINQLKSNAGFFPITEECVVRFCELMISDAKEIDILGSWLKEEYYIKDEIAKAHKVRLGNIEPPYLDSYSEFNWLKALKDKRVLVVHPFVKTIEKQYTTNRTRLFANPEFLPVFELLTIKAVQSIGGNSEFDTWFDALDWMKIEMDKTDYDVCILGCGAYGLPLAAHAKRTGHHAIHLGGATQLLFGIAGRRWEEQKRYKGLFNEYWVHPDASERPANASTVENGCYW